MEKSTRIMLIVICIILVIFLIGVLIWGITMKDFDYSKNYEVVKEEVFGVEEIDKIEVLSRSADITFYETEENNIKVVQKMKRKKDEKRLFKSSNENGTLKIDGRESTRNFCIGFCFFGDVMLEVYVPSMYEGGISAESASGDIAINSEKLSEINAKTASGDIEMKRNVNANEVKLRSISGDIEVGSIKAKNISIETTSGDIETNSLEGDIYVKTVSGEVESTSINGIVDIATTSGDIDVDYFNIIGDSKIHSTSGDVDVILSNESSVRMSADSVSGDIRFPHSESIFNDGKYSLNFKTVSGDITVKVTR